MAVQLYYATESKISEIICFSQSLSPSYTPVAPTQLVAWMEECRPGGCFD